MTDITELAQSLKRRAASANEFGESLYVKADDVIALVEALEKSEKTSEARREAIDRTFNMFVRERDRASAAEDALEKAQGMEAYWKTQCRGITDHCEELQAAMDSESGCLPLDYLQGHKDGLEFASQLAEANHPETGDWLYDDPIELAKAIRKGQDMPPVQSAADSEPDHNPVLAYADSYRDMAKQGVESVPIWSVITDLERNIAPLYLHAQPAPEYPETLPCPVLLEPGLRFGKGVKTILVLEAIQRRAEHYAELEAMPSEERAEYDAGIEAFKAMLPQPAPVVPDGYVLVPKEMTDEIGGAISMRARCCGGIALDIYDGMLAAANCSIPMISERWIPVSERMPEREYVLAADFSGKHYSPCQPNTQVGIYADWFDDGNPTWDDGDGNDLHLKRVTHWMPLPAAPQEVK